MVFSKALNLMQKLSVRNMAQFRHYEGKAMDRDFRYFTLSGIKKNVAVLPLVGIMVVAVVGLSSFIIYCGRTRIDVSFNRNNPMISESMDMLNPQAMKLRIVQQEYKPNIELAAGLEVTRNATK